MKPEFWKSKTVFITGHTGFKGSWLSLWLQKAGANVVGYSLPPPTRPSMFEIARVGNGMRSIVADIRDLDRLKAECRSCAPDIVIHMAAQSLVRYSYQNPVDTYMTNVMGTVNVFEAVRATPGIRAVLNITSDKCYENKEWLWGYRENEPMGGYDPYSSSKGCAELVTSAYRNSFFSQLESSVPVASARAGNVIGGGDWAMDRLIPDIIRACINRDAVEIRNPSAIRPWQHVLEPLGGYLCLLERMCDEGGDRYAEGWNFGPDEGDVRPVSWIADSLTRMWGAQSAWNTDSNDQPHEAHYLKLDCSKAHSLLGWHPRLRLQESLRQVSDWYKAWHNGKDMHEYTMNEISVYEQAQ